MTERENIIKNYIEGYNNFDIDKMVADFDTEILFENVQNGAIDLSLTGLDAFREQAERATQYFSSRTQRIRSFTHSGPATEIEVDYEAILAMDLPNGLKKGQQIHLSGKSVFGFRDQKIISLRDIS